MHHESIRGGALTCFIEYHEANSKKNTVRNYRFVLSRFCESFGERDMESITTEEILSFLTQITQGTKQTTKRSRYHIGVKSFVDLSIL